MATGSGNMSAHATALRIDPQYRRSPPSRERKRPVLNPARMIHSCRNCPAEGLAPVGLRRRRDCTRQWIDQTGFEECAGP